MNVAAAAIFQRHLPQIFTRNFENAQKEDPMRFSQRRGFTMLELLTVVVLVAIAAILMLPTLHRDRQPARRTLCASNLNQIAKAMFMYSDVPANGTFPNNHDEPMESWGLLYNKYVMDPRCFSCPSKPTPPEALQDWKLGEAVPADCAYGYDPSHSPNDAVAPIASDMSLKRNRNSDNHGENSGQNILIGAGTIEFHDSIIMNFGDGKIDPDIFSLNPEISRTLDGFIRQ
jgi:prepilin-type N-terminal cleavage/methylation domain-containing protein